MSEQKMPLLLTCQELDEFIVDYLDGSLSLWQRSKFRLHLLGCGKCRAFLKGYRQSVQLGKKAFESPNSPASEEAPEELIRAILDSRPKKS